MMTDKPADRELDELLGRLRLDASPPAEAPAWPAAGEREDAEVLGFPRRRTLGWIGGGVLAAAAVLVLSVRAPDPAPVRDDGLRGGTAVPVVEPRLWINVERDGQRRRSAPGEGVAVGQRVFFRVGSTAATIVYLWVDGPEGVAHLQELQSRGPAQDLEVAYVFDAVGTYTFFASVEGFGQCAPPSCQVFPLESR